MKPGDNINNLVRDEVDKVLKRVLDKIRDLDYGEKDLETILIVIEDIVRDEIKTNDTKQVRLK